MNHRYAAVAAIFALSLAACSGNFGTGTGIPQQGGIPPVGTTPMPPNNANGLPEGAAQNPNNEGGSPAPAATPAGTYPIADAKDGFACPNMPEGWGCTIAFNLPAPTPQPSGSPSAK